MHKKKKKKTSKNLMKKNGQIYIANLQVAIATSVKKKFK
jgi:hypothetical protein